ncbi:hypothetical protein [Salsuginibacillus kocurii]|uniref:hypothetical protein n=1 Tax=Salsuginibacillus kocurii TaxID=427078 RepID=UPI000375F328|nr:hypothetical protein [Salsuginibacillus kocurii]
MKKTSVAWGGICGFLGAALAVLLTTPKSGKDIRATMKTKPSQELTKEPSPEEWKDVLADSQAAYKVLGQEVNTSIQRFREEIEPDIRTIEQEIREAIQLIRNWSSQAR